jgi:hypothetical protein
LVLKEIERELLNKELIQAQVDKIRRDIITSDLTDGLVGAQTDKVRREIQTATLTDAMLTAQTVNVEQELLNLKAQECVLKSQYDLNMMQKLNVTAQTTLVQQKVATEKAQISGAGVEPDSVIGKQKTLYTAQTDGFKRDAEQKAAKLMTDTWNVRRTTDAGTVADSVNGLADTNIGRAITTMLAGIGA